VHDQPDSRPANPIVGRLGLLVFATLVVCTAFGEVATGLIVPAMPMLGDIFQRPPGTVQLIIVAFAVTFAVGQLFFGPLSDRRGRRPALMIGALLVIAGSVTSATADNLWVVVLGRAVQGLGTAAGYVVARAMVRDIYGANGAPKAMAILFALMAASFLAAPLVGGALIELASWQAGFLFAAIVGSLWLASAIFVMPETLTKAPAAEHPAAYLVYLGLFRHKGLVAYAELYGFVAGAPYFFIESLGLTPASYGMIAAIAMSGFLTGSMTARLAIPRWGMHRVILISLTIMLGAPAVLVVLGLIVWLPLTVIVVMQFFVWFGGGFLAPNTAAGVMMSHPKAAGAAAAVLGFVQMCAAAAVSLLQGLIYDGSVFPMIGTQLVLGLVTLLIWHRLKRHTV
jgi:MFS transporter, DHA1 family, multidrug resistance protein